MNKIMIVTLLSFVMSLVITDAEAVTSNVSRPAAVSRPMTSAPKISTAPAFLNKAPSVNTSTAPAFLNKAAPVANTGQSTNSNVSSKFGQTYNANNIGQKQAAANTLDLVKPKYVPPAEIAKTRQQYQTNTLYVRVRNDRSAYQERTAYFSNPIHIYRVQNSSPSFGMYSGAFLYGMMTNAALAAEYQHNHYNDPDYLAWRREADRLAASNDQLRQQLAAADAQQNAYAQKPVDPNWLPAGVPPAAALADEALKASQPDMNVCVGPENGTYYKVAQQYLLPGSADVANIVPVITKGSLDIRQRLFNGTCDAGFTQGDTQLNGDYETVFSPFVETAHLICYDENAKLSSIKNVNIAQGSGSLMTWRNLASKSSTLNNINVTETLGNEDAIAKTIANKSCLFYVAAPHASQMNKMFERKELWLIPIDDDSLIDINYSKRTLSSADYPEEIQHGWFSNKEIKTLAVPVKFVVSNKWREANPEAAGKFSLELINMERTIRENATGQKQ